MSALLNAPVPLWLVLVVILGLIGGQVIVSGMAIMRLGRSGSRTARDLIESRRDDFEIDLKAAEANLLTWGLDRADRERLLRRYFGGDVLRMSRSGGALRSRPASPAPQGAEPSAPGQPHG